jgi:hypothetical protein
MQDRRKYYAIILAAVLLSIVILYRLANGFWPVPEVVRKMYYASKIDGSIPYDMVLIIDEGFLFDKKGYSLEYDFLYSLKPLAYCLTLEFDNVPLDIPKEQVLNSHSFTTDKYNFSGKIKVELYDDESRSLLLEATDIYSKLSFKEEEGFIKLTYDLGEIPYGLLSKKNKRLKVTVVEGDGELAKYGKSANLLLVPDLRL